MTVEDEQLYIKLIWQVCPDAPTWAKGFILARLIHDRLSLHEFLTDTTKTATQFALGE